MRCSYCGYEDSKVLDSRPVEEGRCIRRRRECLACGRRFTTYERIEQLPMVVVKKDGRREQFDSSKILNGLIKSCDKRSVPVSVLETLVADLEKDLRQEYDREVPASTIGEGVMKRLRAVDEVAYVRFASVYRKFEDISTFMDELRALQRNKKS